MIPQISQAPGVVQLVLNFLQELEQQGFTGDTATSYADRLTMSTDNSIYQLLPDAVVFPRSTADVALIARLAAQERYSSLIFTPRGGGTGTNGQALNQGIIVDMSRHMNRIIEINPEEGWVRVEAGVIKDQLNQYLKPFGYFFAPELSTSNRATLGGMINTDASGQGSLVYGKTSDHVLGVRAVLLGGDILDTQPLPVELAETLGKSNTTIGRIYNTVYQRCRQQRQLIIDNFPKLNRFLTGYDLRHVFNDEMTEFDLTRILTGSEGTLAFITEARLDITRLPKVRRLVNVKYDSFDSALRNAPFMVEARALSVETVDSKVLNLAREDIVWHSVSELITDVPDKEMLGLNIVEFAGDDEALIDERVNALCVRLDELIASQQAGVIGWQVCRELAGVERIYAMRKKAVGLLGNAKGAAKPIPFAEDTCVPPEHLADYIAEFRALLDSHGLSYGMFGHVDAGVLHVRPALDMCDPQQEILMKQISDDVVALTAKYGGLLWGEHGKGFRAEYSPAFFGEELFAELRKVKAAFDPHNRLNPGKICPPEGLDAPMMKVDAVKRGTFDRQIPIPLRDHLVATVESYAPLMARAPKTFNFFINQPLVRKLSEKHIGMVDLPLLSVPSLQQQMVGHRSANMTLEQLEALNAEQKARTVLVVQDPFTSYYDAQVVADFVRLVEKLGFQPVLLPFSPNGKAQHIKGFLNRFAKTAKKTADFLNRMAKLGMPMVGVDPALVLCYRDEYKLALGEERGEFNVLLANEWLASALESQPVATVSGESWYFFGHCTEVTALPGAPAQWAAIFARFGAKLENVSVGCCGMAGTYGHEAKNHKNSLGIYELSWHQAMQRLPRNRCLATGYSCRSQVKRVEGTGVRHPVQALLEIIK